MLYIQQLNPLFKISLYVINYLLVCNTAHSDYLYLYTQTISICILRLSLSVYSDYLSLCILRL